MAKTKAKTGKSYYISIDGERFKKPKEWKIKNPGKLYFDSGLERDYYLMLKDSGLKFDYQPLARELQPSFNATSFSLVTKKIYRQKVRNISYTSDFLIHCNNGTKIYIEAKGFFRADARLRYKLFQRSLESDEITVLLKSRLDLERLIEIIKKDFSTPVEKDEDKEGKEGEEKKSKVMKIDLI